MDLLCLLLELDDGILEIHEEMVGYPTFEEALFKALDLNSEWKLAVLFPAFETNSAMIYQRAGPSC